MQSGGVLLVLGMVTAGGLVGCAHPPPPKVVYLVDYPGFVHEDVYFTPYENSWASSLARDIGRNTSFSERCRMWRWQRQQEPAWTNGSSVAQVRFVDLQVKGTCALAEAEQKQASAARAREGEEAQKQWAERKERLQAVADDEIKAGRCTDARAGMFQGGAVRIKQLLDESTSGGDVLVIDGSKILVATPAGVPFSFTPFGGEVHVFAVSSLPVKLDMRDANNYPVTTGSQFEPVVAMTGAETDGRALVANPHSAIAGRVVGAGCTLILLVHRL